MCGPEKVLEWEMQPGEGPFRRRGLDGAPLGCQLPTRSSTAAAQSPAASEGRVLVVDGPQAPPALHVHLIVTVPRAGAGRGRQGAAAPQAAGQLLRRGHQVEDLLHGGAAAEVVAGREPGAAGGRELDQAELGGAAVAWGGERPGGAGTCWGGERGREGEGESDRLPAALPWPRASASSPAGLPGALGTTTT